MPSFNDWLVAIGAGRLTGSPHEADKNKQTDQQRAADEKTKWDQDRGFVNNEWSSLLSEYGGGTFDAPAIKAQDPFETMSHQQIYNALEGVQEGEINAKADGWRNLSTDARNAVEEFKKGVEQDITEHWNGKSGTSAIDATREFSTSFAKLAATFQMVGHGLDLTQGHLAQAKASVGKPDSYTVGDRLIDALPLQNVIKGPTHRAQEAESEARFVMTQYYRPGVNEVDKITPILPEPTTTVDKNNPGGPISNPSSNPTGNPTSADPTGSPNATDPKSADDPKKPDTTTPQSTQPAGTNQNPTSDKPTSTTPASTTPATPSNTDDPTKSRTPSTPSSTPSTTFPGTPSRTPGTPSSTPSPGKSVPGKAATPTTTAASTAARAASTGKAGAAGMPGMGAPGARGKGDEDGEHKTPDYLIYDRGSELLGTQPPALPPGGVIGG
ncbi:hypothetical protein [Nocardia ninae]|uniref:PPE family domain-containing protein n=1 Tax=Nocardia ninae NBRC 108245 TaxID=1210091 RepID=A0A511MJ30_9NOCA|nr:hypothetical protein [Nocardia ninae]GEM40644.1 hypothetical protein NN4_51630 [Nocardia ninae NBRC 108245]